MGVFAGPDVSESGLVLAVDGANIKSFDGRENLVSYSTYNASTWVNNFPSGASLTTGIDAPDGTNTAVRFTCTNTTNALLRVAIPSFTPNGTDTYTSSFYVRKISGTGNATTDLHDGNPFVDYSSQLITNQWVRVTVSGVPTATAKTFLDLFSDNNTNYVLDFWGVQLEKNPIATTYAPTSGSTITRGTTLTDLSGLSNTGTLTNGPTYSSANSGSVVFDATNKYINYGNILNFTTESFTFNIFFYLTSITTNTVNQGPILFFKGGFNSNGYYLQLTQANPSQVYFFTNQSGASQATISSSSVVVGAWNNISVTRSGSSVRIYINGVDATLSAGTHINPASSSDNFQLAAYGNFIFANIRIASFQAYNRVLTAAEIQQNFNANRGRYGI